MWSFYVSKYAYFVVVVFQFVFFLFETLMTQQHLLTTFVGIFAQLEFAFDGVQFAVDGVGEHEGRDEELCQHVEGLEEFFLWLKRFDWRLDNNGGNIEKVVRSSGLSLQHFLKEDKRNLIL